MPDDQELDSSVMDRTKKLRQKREEFKRKARQQHSAEEEAGHLDQIVAGLKEKVEATRAAKARAAESRRLIDDLQSELAAEEEIGEASEQDSDSPVSKSDIGALIASSLQTAMSIAHACFIAKYTIYTLSLIHI